MSKIGRYEVSGELGRGAMGVVYKALDPAIGRTIAIKTIRFGEFGSEGERQRLKERLKREAQSAGMLSHPHIVTIYDISDDGENTYIYMEFVDGKPLEDVIEHGPLPSNAVFIDILKQTASALDYAHSKGIVHRDIKPGNILLHESRVAKVADFGVAKIQSQNLTQTGMVMGTPNYMSPEQIRGKQLDGRSDQWALAVIAYEMLSGERPFQADSLPSLMFKIVQEVPARQSISTRRWAGRVDQVLQKALAKDPTQRYETCTQFIDDLAEALNASPGWRPLPPGSASSLPTMAEPVEVTSTTSGASRASMSAIDVPPLPPEPVKPEPVKPEPVKAEPVKQEAPKQEIAPDWRPEPEPESKGKGLWIGIAAVAVLGIVGALWILMKPSQRQIK